MTPLNPDALDKAREALKESLRDTIHHDGPIHEADLAIYDFDHATQAAIQAYLSAANGPLHFPTPAPKGSIGGASW